MTPAPSLVAPASRGRDSVTARPPGGYGGTLTQPPTVGIAWSVPARAAWATFQTAPSVRRANGQLRRVLGRTLALIPVATKRGTVPLSSVAAVIDVSLVSDGEIKSLNNTYRGKDRPTDVLSFAQDEGVLCPSAPADFRILGDIVIAVETAHRQASDKHHSLEHECLFLAIHGLLHLLGYDHATASQRRIMWRCQHEVMQAVGLG